VAANGRYVRDVVGLVEQLHQMEDRAQEVAQSTDGPELRSRLTNLEHSLDILKICVSALRYQVDIRFQPPPIRPRCSSKL
jgi:hypothetical protein